MTKLVFIDTETTGIDPQKHALIQMAGIVVIDNEVKEEFDFRVRPFPEDVVDLQALVVNNVKEEDLTGYPEPLTVIRQAEAIWRKYVDRYAKSDKFWFVGYNARFDYDFIRRLWEKAGQRYFGAYFFFPPLDVMNLAAFHLMDRRSTLPNFKLSTVAEALGLKAEGELHDAVTDIRLTQKMFAVLTTKATQLEQPATTEKL
jgi:DNA polymerase-3 subunit epsilon